MIVLKRFAQNERIGEKIFFKPANEHLYKILANIYDVYLDAKDFTSINQRKYDMIHSMVKNKKISISSNPTFIQLLTKYVFSDDAYDSRRVSSYSRVLNCAKEQGIGNSAEIPEFIRKNGGIEEIRSKMSKNTKPLKRRAEEGRYYANNASNLAVVESNIFKPFVANGSGKYLVLLGVLTEQGTVEVKHCVFEENVSTEIIPSKTVINGALSNLYATKEKIRKSAKGKETEEATAKSRSNAFIKAQEESSKNEDDSITSDAA